MKGEAFEKFVNDKLEWLKDRYEQGAALSCGEAHLLCLKNNKKPGETFTEERPLGLFCAIRGGDAEIRYRTQQEAKDNDAFAVMVKMEAWFAQVPTDDADEALKERIRRAYDEQTIDQLEPGIRREKLIVYFESIEEPIRAFDAEIIRDGKKATLKPWKRAEIELPRPTFRRYLAEYRDGKKTFGLSVPGGGTIRLVYGDGKS